MMVNRCSQCCFKYGRVCLLLGAGGQPRWDLLLNKSSLEWTRESSIEENEESVQDVAGWTFPIL